jgi:arginine-tRNA-protein transferase
MNEFNNPRNHLKLYKTEPHACSYIDGLEATTLFVDPNAEIDQRMHTYFSEQGYRRSGSILYKPDCTNCQACMSIRIRVNDYSFSRSEKRILKRNNDLNIFEIEDIRHDDIYQLYENYITQRHADGDMFPPNREQYENFFNNPFGNTRFVAFALKNTIKAVAIIDNFTNGLSAVYTFFDPNDEERSLGTLAVLWQIQEAKTLNLPYVYLGYWVKQCQKMNYKTRFQPSEIYINKRWVTLIHNQS